jgi:hypothetical protein
MKNRYAALTVAVGLAGVLLLGQILFGQAPGAGAGRGGGRGGVPTPPPGPIVRTKDGKPDLTGYWMTTLRIRGPILRKMSRAARSPTTPSGSKNQPT